MSRRKFSNFRRRPRQKRSLSRIRIEWNRRKVSLTGVKRVSRAILNLMEKTRRKSAKLRPIARKRHNFIYLLLSILLAISTVYLFLTFPPEHSFALSNFGIPVLPIFLASLTGFIFSTLTFIFIQKAQGIILSLLILFYLILRLIGLTHWIFGVMFLALFITTELFVLKNK